MPRQAHYSQLKTFTIAAILNALGVKSARLRIRALWDLPTGHSDFDPRRGFASFHLGLPCVAGLAAFSNTMSFSPADSCGPFSTNCVLDVSFAPTTIGTFFESLTFLVMELPISITITNDEFSVDVFGTAGVGVSNTPLPAALPLFATGIGGLGLLGRRRRRKAGTSLSEAA